jgi:hypothetical protein
MKKVLEILKKIWVGFKTLALGEEFKLAYPFAVLGLIALIDKGFFAVTAWIIWTIAGILNILKQDGKTTV